MQLRKLQAGAAVPEGSPSPPQAAPDPYPGRWTIPTHSGSKDVGEATLTELQQCDDLLPEALREATLASDYDEMLRILNIQRLLPYLCANACLRESAEALAVWEQKINALESLQAEAQEMQIEEAERLRQRSNTRRFGEDVGSPNPARAELVRAATLHREQLTLSLTRLISERNVLPSYITNVDACAYRVGQISHHLTTLKTDWDVACRALERHGVHTLTMTMRTHNSQ
jgi:hypothetical protein